MFAYVFMEGGGGLYVRECVHKPNVKVSICLVGWLVVLGLTALF